MQYIVREGTFEDRFGAVSMMKQFYAVTQPPFPFLPVHAEALYKRYADEDNRLALVVVVEDKVQGLFLAAIEPMELSPKIPFATERLWWISEKARNIPGNKIWQLMLDWYEAWWTSKGAAGGSMTSYGSERTMEVVSRLLRRKGYQPLELHHMKLTGIHTNMNADGEQ